MSRGAPPGSLVTITWHYSDGVDYHDPPVHGDLIESSGGSMYRVIEATDGGKLTRQLRCLKLDPATVNDIPDHLMDWLPRG